MASKVQSWKIFDPAAGGCRGVVRGKSNNKLAPGQCPDMYNYVSDGGPKKRNGNTLDNAIELVLDTGITGIFQFFNGSTYRIFAKCGERLFDVSVGSGSTFLLSAITKSGDAGNQMSDWNFIGAGNLNTSNGILFGKLTNSGTTRTVEVYKNYDGVAANLVCSGSRTGDGVVTLNEQNASGLTGSVSVIYSFDDTDLENNLLIFTALNETAEVQFESWLGRYFITDGINIYTGTTGTASAISFLDENGNPISGIHPHGKSIIQKGQRLWLTRDPNYPTRLWFSLIDYYDRFPTGGGSDALSWVACDRDDGHAITGFVVYNEQIFVTKTMKHYWIYGYPSDVWPYSGTLQVSDGIPGGCYDQKTLINCDDGYLRWYGPSGVWQYGPNGLSHISDAIDYELNKIVESDRIKACAAYGNNYYVLLLPNGISEYCDGFLFDVRISEWFPIKNWNISCMARFIDGSIHGGFYNKGYTAKLFSGNTDNSGAEDIACYLKTRLEVPLGYEYRRFEHCLDKLQVFNIRNGQKFMMYWNAEDGSPASGSWTFSYESVGAYLDEFQLGDEIADDGDLLISVDELSTISANPVKRGLGGNQRFQQIYFEIEESGPTDHAFDYLQIDSYPIGEAR